MTAAACARHLPPWLASRIVTEFSHPGDVLIVPDSGDAALLTAAARHERQITGYTLSRGHAQRIRRALAAELRPAQRRLVHVRVGWPSPPPGAVGASRARLVIGLTPCQTRHPGCARPAVFTARVTSLCQAASQLLADGGTLIVVTTASPSVTITSDRVTSVAKTAEGAGFALRQLVAAVHTPVVAPRAVAPASRPADRGTTHRRQPGSQFDLLVLGRAHPRRRAQRGPRGTGEPPQDPGRTSGRRPC